MWPMTDETDLQVPQPLFTLVPFEGLCPQAREELDILGPGDGPRMVFSNMAGPHQAKEGQQRGEM